MFDSTEPTTTVSESANASTGPGIARFGRVCRFTPDARRSAAVAALAARLRALPEYSRKLLAHVVDLACRAHQDGRKAGAAYLPELHETCGLGVDEMYAILQQLEESRLLRLEGEYPFQDVVLAEEPELGWPLLQDLANFCSTEKIPLRSMIVDVRLDLLA